MPNTITQTDPRTPHSFAICGGDDRMLHVAERLAENSADSGNRVTLLGCGENCFPREPTNARIRHTASLARATEHATTLVLPLPATRDGVTLWCPRDLSCHVTFSELTDLLVHRPDLSLFGGRLPVGFAETIPPDPVTGMARVIDYYNDESLQLVNAYLTAEAAVMTAMGLTDHALRGSTVAIIGYGRIAKLLARLLLSLGVDVTVAARREEALLWAEMEGCHPIRLGDESRAGGGMFPLCYGHPVIFNTVPAHVLPRNLLLCMEKGTVIIDLASAPFGVSDEDVREATDQNGLCYVRVPSLPGTYAPRDAGYAIADSILRTLRETPPKSMKGDETS